MWCRVWFTSGQVFAFTPHQGSVRALAIPHEGNKAGQLLVSGGADEHIRLYDLRRRAETGELLYHKGTVTCLTFIGSTHLLSAGEDGIVCIWRYVGAAWNLCPSAVDLIGDGSSRSCAILPDHEWPTFYMLRCRVHDWSLLHILGGHKGPVNSLAVHPSGKLALSGGRDRTLRLWDLVNGRCAYIQRLEVCEGLLK
jgi:protein MAK11